MLGQIAFALRDVAHNVSKKNNTQAFLYKMPYSVYKILKNMNNTTLITSLIILSLSSLNVLGQSFWNDFSIDEEAIQKKQSIANSYRSILVDMDFLKKDLINTPKNLKQANLESNSLIEVPMPDGSSLNFVVFETQTMEDGLAQKFPNIKSYVGYNPDSPLTKIRFDVSHKGFNAMITGNQNPVFIDALRDENNKKQVKTICYFKKDFIRTQENNFECLFESNKSNDDKKNVDYSYKVNDSQLRTYRIAAACNGEFTNYHGGTVADGIAAANTTINRVNQIYERDLGVKLVLIANNDNIVYTNPLSDPYTNNDPSAMLSENQSNIDNVIGSSFYDVGHVFTTGGGGIAVNGLCSNQAKARGVTGLSNPIGDPFYIDYVAHEIGHQFGASHTFNNSCNDNIFDDTAVEPGSGSTIMAYAGICPPNIQSNSDDYFHAISINQILNKIQYGEGADCSSNSSSSNNVPEVYAGVDKYIPIGTPFELTATASDPDGNQLTYCWEQIDAGTAPMPPQSSSIVGPLFRSLDPSSSPTRIFPDNNTIINNLTDTWEVLPNVTRDLNFSVVVRDNNPGNGTIASDAVLLKSTSSAGPFLVTNPNSNLTWLAGSQETIIWDVANTEKPPVLCSLVDILLSTNSGNTFDYVIAENVINSGSHTFIVPENIGTQNRIKIKCSDNVFFDISDQNFSIQQNLLAFDVNTPNTTIYGCENQQISIPINTQSFTGSVDPVSFSVNGVPASAIASFSPNPIQPGSSTFLNISGLTSGSSSITITATDGTLNQSFGIDLKIGTPSASTPIYPSTNSNSVELSPVFNWTYSDLAQYYSIKISTDVQFSNIIESATNIIENKYILTTILEEQTTYYWSITAHNSCGESEAINSFTTYTVPYCTSSGNSNFEWIQSFSLADLNNNSGNNGGYQDFTALTANVIAGESYSIALNPGFSTNSYPEYWKVWVDFNRNGSFDDVGELIFESTNTTSQLVNGIVTIPADISPISTRMRVSMHWETPQESCENIDYGEVEDYTIVVSSNCGNATEDSDLDGICDGLDICPGGNDNIDMDNNGIPDDCQEVDLALKIWLEGANLTDEPLMSTYINELNLLPNLHPYSDPATYNYSQPTTLTSIPTNMVDWVYVEIRTGLNNTDFLDHKVGLLMNDGTIKDLDGTTNLKFDLPPNGSYYILVRHRNHLDVLSANPIARNINMSYDFTVARSNALGGVQKLSSNGKAMLFAGDIDGNMQIQITDFDQWKLTPAANQVYNNADIDMDGQVQITDYDMWYYNRSVIAPAALDY